MKANKTTQWAGYSASFFGIIAFVLAMKFMDSPPSWIHVVAGWCLIFALCSMVVCLVSAVFGVIRNRLKKSN
jgi:hypothetical protein